MHCVTELLIYLFTSTENDGTFLSTLYHHFLPLEERDTAGAYRDYWIGNKLLYLDSMSH